jgi:hypothetical protein
MDNGSTYIRAIRLFNTNDTDCSFETGKIATHQQIEVGYFFGQTGTGTLENVPHPAPRRQYVVTLKGRLQFTVTNGDTFIIEPGIILIAEDTEGPGHTWEITDGDQWERIYLPFDTITSPAFIPDLPA